MPYIRSSYENHIDMSTKLKPLPAVLPGAKDFDAHCHLDRGDTSTYPDGKPLISPNASLVVKQSAVRELHDSIFYTEENLYTRMRSIVEQKILAGERGMNALVDCTPDLNGRAFKVAMNLRAECQKVGYELNVGAYALWGINEIGSPWHDAFIEAAESAQFLASLPERDDRPNHPIGFDGNLHFMITQAIRLGVPLQVHTDQTRTPSERGTERLVDAVYWLVTANPEIPRDKRPKITAVHVLSPNTYTDERHAALVAGMAINNIDVCVCPWATAANRQIRSILAPTDNSIARVPEFLLAKIPVSIGTDNINDMFMSIPKTPLLRREFDQLCTLLRYDDEAVVEKLFTQEPLDDTDRESLREWKAANDEAYAAYES